MIHPKISSPSRTPQRKKRQSHSGRTSSCSAKSVQHDEETIPIPSEPEDPVPIRYSDLYKQEKAQAEMGNMFKKKKSYPIAPDALIPNSSFRTVFKPKEIKPVEIKAFQLRLDILDNLQNINKNLNWQDDDDELTELDDPDAESKPVNEKKSKGTLVSRQNLDNGLLSEDLIHNIYWNQDTMPDLFKRMQNESWWKQAKDEKLNLRSMLLYLNEILKLKQIDSYESACYYVVEIFRTYGIEPVFVNQILEILLNHLIQGGNGPLDICSIRTIAQFMIERKDIIIRLLEYALKYQSGDMSRLETINAIKFISEVNNSEDIELVLDHMSVVYDSSEDNFSLKMIIKGLENKKKIVVSEVINEGEEKVDGVHPLLKKISEERWFPRGNYSITLDYVLEAITSKLPDTTKTMVKTLTTHLIQLQRIIGYLNEQFDQVSNALISLLSHTDADFRLIAATNLANLSKETKAIDIALLNSFLNDPRILVRTECCDSLKKLTGIMSDTVLKDCADDIPYLQTLSEENFSLQNYLKEKNRLPTPPSASVDEQPALPIEETIPTNEIEETLVTDQIEKTVDIILPVPQIIEQPAIINTLPEPTQFSTASSVTSSMTPVQPSIRVEINEKNNSVALQTPRSRKERTPIQNTRQSKRSKSPVPDQINKKDSTLLPNNTTTWDSYAKQNEIAEGKETNESELNFFPDPQASLINDPIQTIIEEHKQTLGFYRMIQNRRVLVPHKISMDNVLAEQSHLLINQYLFQTPLSLTNSMNLSDLNQNQNQLNEMEFVQLLSSLVIRAIQVHRQYEKLVPSLVPTKVTNGLSISQMHLYSSSNLQQLNVNSSLKLPPIVHQQPTARQFARIQSNIQAKATREGINVQKARNMEGALSNVLRSTREQTKSTMISSSSVSHSSTSKQTDVTHAWFLVHLLNSQGIFNSESYLQKVIQSYPKFIPIFHTKIPQNLISIIWNDPIIKQIASILSNKQDQSSVENSSIKRNDTKPSVPLTDDEYSSYIRDYSSLTQRDDHRKKFLPPIREPKTDRPHHVVKFGFREIEMNFPDSPNNSSREESRSRSRKRRAYMHLMMPANENMFDRKESVKSQLQQMFKTDYQTISYVPIVTRPPRCH